jgi:soluble lytic murein transglycosylase-like protein
MTIGQLVKDMARQHGIELPLILALMKVESNFKPDAVSKTGAAGLMQLTSDTARDLGLRVPNYRDETKPNRDPNVDERFDPAKSVRNGTQYLREMLEKYDDNYILAIAAYNAGPGNVNKNVPLIRETERHANKVLNYYFRYKNSPETRTKALQILESVTSK